jgi:hypothetical protein
MDMISQINTGILAGELKMLVSTVTDTENDRMQDGTPSVPAGK